jgi:hypothetical protein
MLIISKFMSTSISQTVEHIRGKCIDAIHTTFGRIHQLDMKIVACSTKVLIPCTVNRTLDYTLWICIALISRGLTLISNNQFIAWRAVDRTLNSTSHYLHFQFDISVHALEIRAVQSTKVYSLMCWSLYCDPLFSFRLDVLNTKYSVKYSTHFHLQHLRATRCFCTQNS